MCVQGWKRPEGASHFSRGVMMARGRLPEKEASLPHQGQERSTATPGRKPSCNWPPSTVLSYPTWWFQPTVLQKVMERTWPPGDRELDVGNRRLLTRPALGMRILPAVPIVGAVFKEIGRLERARCSWGRHWICEWARLQPLSLNFRDPGGRMRRATRLTAPKTSI